MRMSAYSFPELAQVTKAMGDQTRMRMLHLLLRRGELCVCDIESCLQLSQSKTSRHLAYLRNAGMVTARRDRNWVHYKLNMEDPVVAGLMRVIRAALATDLVAIADLERHDSCCSPQRCDAAAEGSA